MILSLGTRTVSNAQKFGVSLENARTRTNLTTGRNDEESTWKLHIKNIKETDRGCYMCQVNTVPMLNQLGCVDVLGRYACLIVVSCIPCKLYHQVCHDD